MSHTSNLYKWLFFSLSASECPACRFPIRHFTQVFVLVPHSDKSGRTGVDLETWHRQILNKPINIHILIIESLRWPRLLLQLLLKSWSPWRHAIMGKLSLSLQLCLLLVCITATGLAHSKDANIIPCLWTWQITGSAWRDINDERSVKVLTYY